MNFSIAFLKILQETELQMLTSILFHSISATGKKEFLEFIFVLKKKKG